LLRFPRLLDCLKQNKHKKYATGGLAYLMAPSADFLPPRSDGLFRVPLRRRKRRHGPRSPGVSFNRLRCTTAGSTLSPAVEWIWTSLYFIHRSSGRLRPRIRFFVLGSATFASRFFRTLPLGDSPCASLTLTSIRFVFGGLETSPPSYLYMPVTQRTRSLAGNGGPSAGAFFGSGGGVE